MSFYTEIEASPNKQNINTHLPMSVRLQTAEHNQLKDKVVLPPQNFFTGIQKINPQSSFNSTNLFTSGSNLDFWLNYNGYVENLRLELKLHVNPAAANPLSILGPYLLERVELYDTNQNIMQTWYSDMLFYERINFGIDKSAFENACEGVNNTTYLSTGPYAANAKFTLNINLPCAITDSQLKGNIIEGRVLVRVYFSATGITAGANTDLWCDSAVINSYCDQLSGALESKETQRKRQCSLNYRILNPQRVCSFVISNAQPSQYYDIQLVSGTQLSAYIFFLVRPSPLNSTNVQSLVTGINFEFYDQNMQLQSITQTPEANRFIVSQKHGGAIFNSALGAGIYVLPFSVNPHAAKKGVQNGFYALSQRETIRVIMPSTLVPGNYLFEAISLDYAEMIVKNGRLDFKK